MRESPTPRGPPSPCSFMHVGLVHARGVSPTQVPPGLLDPQGQAPRSCPQPCSQNGRGKGCLRRSGREKARIPLRLTGGASPQRAPDSSPRRLPAGQVAPAPKPHRSAGPGAAGSTRVWRGCAVRARGTEMAEETRCSRLKPGNGSVRPPCGPGRSEAGSRSDSVEREPSASF